MYKNWEDLFNSIKGDWNFGSEQWTDYFKYRGWQFRNNHIVCNDIAHSSLKYSLAEIFDDKEAGNACEILARLFLIKTRGRVPSQESIKIWEKHLRQKIFESKDKLEAINNFMRG